MLIYRREKVGIETLKNSKSFIYYSQTADDAYESLEDYNLTKKRKVIIIFRDMMADIEANKKISQDDNAKRYRVWRYHIPKGFIKVLLLRYY